MSGISVGDLVQVVRWPCCAGRIGLIFRVERITSRYQRFKCPCGFGKRNVGEALGWDGIPDGDGAPLSWLKRIPPLSELEGVKTEEQIKEPA